MKLVILAGGKGTRFVEETSTKPKPMIDVGGKPIIWQIMKYYSMFNVNEFIICCGYKQEVIKKYFSKIKKENWKVNLVDTGYETNTAGRIKKIKKYVKNEKYFFFTYGDGLSNININKQIKFHETHKRLATVTAVQPPARFGAILLDPNRKNLVKDFKEKNDNNNILITGGFFILSPECIDYIKSYNKSW